MTEILDYHSGVCEDLGYDSMGSGGKFCNISEGPASSVLRVKY